VCTTPEIDQLADVAGGADVVRCGPTDGEVESVALFRRGRSARPGKLRPASREDIAHLEAFARERRGVEGFIEPRTTVTETTLILIAFDGEWTRRRIGSPEEAWRFGQRVGVPIYDVALVGYPNRLREYNARQKS
jgi:hypothetical protein